MSLIAVYEFSYLFTYLTTRVKSKGKHLYSALHGTNQTTLKHSGMDRTVFNLQKNTMPAFTS